MIKKRILLSMLSTVAKKQLTFTIQWNKSMEHVELATKINNIGIQKDTNTDQGTMQTGRTVQEKNS